MVKGHWVDSHSQLAEVNTNKRELSMDLKLRREMGWLVVNGLVASVFLWLSSTQWIEPELKNVSGASGGGPVVFSLIVLSLLGPLLIVNLIWIGVAVRRGVRTDDWRSLPIIGVIGAVWICTVAISASRL